MLWIYILYLLFLAFYMVKILGLRTMRVFGIELFGFLLIVLILTLITIEIVLVMPQYYIKHQAFSDNFEPRSKFSLNRILEHEVKKAGIDFDDGSFEILDSHGMSFNHLFLCSYRINGKEEVRILPFEKNIFGDMKPKYPLSETYNMIPQSNNRDDYYYDYVEDGILGGYLVTAGYASENTVVENYQLNHFYIDQIHPSNYFLWVELVKEPWKSELAKFALILLGGYLVSYLNSKNRVPIKFYSRWRKGDKIFQVVKDIKAIK